MKFGFLGKESRFRILNLLFLFCVFILLLLLKCDLYEQERKKLYDDINHIVNHEGEPLVNELDVPIVFDIQQLHIDRLNDIHEVLVILCGGGHKLIQQAHVTMKVIQRICIELIKWMKIRKEYIELYQQTNGLNNKNNNKNKK